MLSIAELVNSRESKKNEGSRSGAPRGQNFEGMKLRTNANGSVFSLSNKFWEQFNLDENGFFQVTRPEGVFLVLVSDVEESKGFEPTMLKRTGKTKNKTNQITSNILESALVKADVIKKVEDSDFSKNKPFNQYISLDVQETPDDERIKAIFLLSADTSVTDDDDSDDDSDDVVEDTIESEDSSNDSILGDY